MTQESGSTKRFPFFRKVFRFIFWPVRHWIFTLVTLALLVAAYAITVQIFQSKLDALYTAAKAAGEATSLEDFQVKDLTDDNNAAVVYRRAQSQFIMPDGADFDKKQIWKRYTSLKTYTPPQETQKGRGEEEPSGPLTPEEEAMVDTYVTSNGPAYETIREASAKPLCQFGDYSTPSKVMEEVGSSTSHNLSMARAVARAIALRAVWEARHGNTDAAYEWIGHGLHLANNLQNDPLLIHGLVRVAMVDLTLNSLDTIMCETPWSGKLPDGFEQELTQILDRNLFARCFEGERFFGEAYEALWGSFPRLMDIPIRHALYKAQSGIIAAVREPDFTKRGECIAEVERYVSMDGKSWSYDSDTNSKKETKQAIPKSMFPSYKILAQITAPAILRAIEAFDRAVAQAQNAHQALALKRYKQTQGQYPDQLQQLISGDFKALPIDPFNGEPFHYKKEGEGFLLYSVGRNRVDEGGISGSRMDGDIVWRVTQ